MMGTNFCLLSSVDTKLLSSWMGRGQHGWHTPGPLAGTLPHRFPGLKGFGDVRTPSLTLPAHPPKPIVLQTSSVVR